MAERGEWEAKVENLANFEKNDAYDSYTSSVMEKLANLGNVSSGIDLGDRLPDQLLLDGNDALVVLQPVHFRVQRL